jgi:HK97 gp10 family phage protein
MADELAIRGGRALDEALRTLVPKIQRNIMKSALRAGANVIKNEAKANAPVGPTSGENARLYGGYAGALRDSIRTSVGTDRSGRISAAVKVGGKTKKGADVFYAHFVEFGTRPHLIKAKPGEALSIGGSLHQSVQHPGMRPQPFFRPAFDNKAQAALTAVAEQIRRRLTKENINVPAPEALE